MTRFSLHVFLATALAISGQSMGKEALQRTAADPTKLSDEYLRRWTPGGNTNVSDLPYPHITAKYQTETDADWRDDRWQRTQKGPFVSHSILLPDHQVGPKLLAVAAGPGKYLLFDTTSASFVAGVTDGELLTDPARFGLLNRPRLLGQVEFFVPAGRAWRAAVNDAPVPPVECDYQGLYLHGDRVVLASKIAGIEVLESLLPSDSRRCLTREIEIAPHGTMLWLALSTGAERAIVAADGRSVEWEVTQGQRQRITLDAGSPGVRLAQQGTTILLCWPETSTPTSARVSYLRPNARSIDSSASSSDSFSELPQLQSLRRPGPRRWGEPLATKGVLGQVAGESPYVVDRIEPPRDNPFAALFFITGVDFFTNGDAAVCTAHGDVWIVRGLDASLQHVTWQRFATGLYQPLGLEIVDDQVIVLGRDQLTRLHDENADGEADFYESFNHDLVVYGTPHAYAMRLERTPDGSFVFCKSGDPPHGSAVLRVSPAGDRLEVLAHGFRHPFGLGAGPHGEITVADNEGNWVPSSKIDLIRQDGFYGFLGSAESPADGPGPLRPLCYIPKVADNSCGGQIWHTSDRWGPYHRGGMFHFSWGRRTLHAVLTQQVGATWQAATVEVPGVLLQAGPAEAEFHPHDGQLYVVSLDGWQTGAEADGSFERIRYTGRPLHLPSTFAVHTNGIRLRFEEPIDPQSVQQEGGVRVEQWNYRWSSTYGSYHYSVIEPERVGHDVVAVQQVDVSDDGRQLFLTINGLQKVDQLQVSLNLRTMAGAAISCKLYGTINALAPTYESPATSSLRHLLSKENLVAWCIVPFDSRKRDPEQRAAMLEELGIHRVAYDWRAEHVPTFDDELEAYARHGIALHAFWMPVDTDTPLSEAHWPIVLDLVRRHNVQPQLWVMLNNRLVEDLPQVQRVRRAADILAPVARAAAEQNCSIGFYNHGGWWGQPENEICVVNALRLMGIDNTGLVYSFHHGHEHVAKFARLACEMQPYLLTVDINGMRDNGPQILPIGQGEHESVMLQALISAGYQGPIGILHHRDGVDAKLGLEENLHGIDHLLRAR